MMDDDDDNDEKYEINDNFFMKKKFQKVTVM